MCIIHNPGGSVKCSFWCGILGMGSKILHFEPAPNTAWCSPIHRPYLEQQGALLPDDKEQEAHCFLSGLWRPEIIRIHKDLKDLSYWWRSVFDIKHCKILEPLTEQACRWGTRWVSKCLGCCANDFNLSIDPVTPSKSPVSIWIGVV